MIVTDKAIKEAIKAKLIAGSGSSTRVLTRWKLSLDKHDWKGALRSLTDNGKVDGWFITRVGRASRQVAVNQWELVYRYSLYYFRSVREGVSASNSEDELNVLLDAVADQFERDYNLGFDSEDSGVDYHDGLQILDIDVIEDQIHIVPCELAVRLTKQL